MKNKKSILVFVMLVSTLMLMSNALASGGPPFWFNQAMLSTPDLFTSQDPENSGYGATQVVVWEEWNGNDWDIYMKYSPAPFNGAMGSWIFSGAGGGGPPVHPATTALDEINPAVTVTNTGLTEIHVVYQRENPNFPGTWDVYHTWTNNFGAAWTAPVVLDAVRANDATDPAIVFTEDFNVPLPPLNGMLVQIVWSEFDLITGFYEIQYDAYYFDPTLVPVRGFVGTTLIRACPVGDCLYPEIASVDETLNPGTYDYSFSIVWEEPVNFPPLQITVWYCDGTTTTSPVMVVAPGFPGRISPGNPGGDCYHPDISATHNYVLPITTYYFHVNWVFQTNGPPVTYQIDSCYNSQALTPTPGPGAFTLVLIPAQGPVATVLDNPTIASKLLNMLPPPQFETWMAWEDSSTPASAPDIWYRVGLYNPAQPPPLFGYTMPAPLMVPYLPQPPTPGITEYNPELWNKNDAMWIMPPPTHLVFDMTSGQGFQEVEYIDP